MAVQLRPEALALSVPSPNAPHGPVLNESQDRAVRSILALLKDAVQMVKPGPAGDGGRTAADPFDPKRGQSSQIALLSGERGTGKTTVYLSLQAMCRGAVGLDAGAPRLTVPDDLGRQVEAVARRTVWLDALDMEPLPAPTNLLAAILARVDEAARAIGAPLRTDSAGEPRYSGLLEGSADQDALLKLRHLQTQVAVSWEGNLRSRQGNLDADAFAIEVLRAERSRLALNEGLNKVLTAVAALYRAGPVTDPVFILPVDDFDLNPQRSLELLRLLRAFSAPRLFTLILGDERVAELIVNLRLSGELAGVAGERTRSELLSIPPAEVQSMARELASHALRKLLPPAQIFRLTSMSVTEALNYLPPGAQENLFQVLKRCQVYVDQGDDPGDLGAAPAAGAWEIKRLFDFLFTPFFREQGWTDPPPAPPADTDASPEAITQWKNVSAYRALAVFQTTPRRVTDLWFGLQDVAAPVGAPGDAADRRQRHRALVDLVGHRCRRTVGEDTTITPRARQRLLDGLTNTPDGEWALDPQTFEVEPDVDFGSCFEGPPLPTPPPTSEDEDDGEPRYFIHAYPIKGWNLYPRRPAAAADRRDTLKLEESTAAHLRLLRDLLVLGPQRRGPIQPLVWTKPPNKRCAKTEWRLDHQRSVEISWPTPTWHSFWEYDLFFTLWDRALAGSPGSAEYPPDERLAFLVYTWIDGAVTVLTWGRPLAVNAPARRSRARRPTPDWPGLVARLEALALESARNSPWATAVRDWLSWLAFLLMPEIIGFQRPITDSFAASSVLAQAWNREVNEIRRYRNTYFGRFHEQGLGEVAAFLRGQVPQGFPVRLGHKVPRPGSGTGRRRSRG